MAGINKEDVLSFRNANMLEISELISDIEDKFGVTAAQLQLLWRQRLVMELLLKQNQNLMLFYM